MSRTSLLRVAGISLAGLIAVSMGTRPSARAVSPPPAAAVGAAALGGAVGGGGGDEPDGHGRVVHLAAPPMTPEAAKTWMKLQEKVGINFATDTPLEDVKKFIEEVTADKDDPASGIPLYFDPRGLQDADKTMASTVNLAFKKPVPLATSLGMLLEQVGLKYHIQKDGIVVITNKESDALPVEIGPEVLESLTKLRDEVRFLRAEVHLMMTGKGPAPPALMGSVGGTAPPAGGGTGGGFR